LQSFTQPLGVLESDFRGRICDPFTAQLSETRGLQSRNLHTQRAHNDRRSKRSNVQTDLYRKIALDEWREPSGCDGPGICHEHQDARILAIQLQVVRTHFATGWRYQVRKRTSAKRQ
jgi:hypothetical protein